MMLFSFSRHGRKHTISPTNVNYRANMWALKEEGCTHVLVTTACGSLKEEIRPGDIVILDQFIDRTFKREPSFYDDNPLSPRGICHLQMDLPFCEKTRQVREREGGRRGRERGGKRRKERENNNNFSSLSPSFIAGINKEVC